MPCRRGRLSRAHYDRFLARHRDYLGIANHRILDAFAARVGPLAAIEALDRASVRMANHYGVRRTYGCHELKLVAIALSNGPTSNSIMPQMCWWGRNWKMACARPMEWRWQRPARRLCPGNGKNADIKTSYINVALCRRTR
jgi:hypothetical protein